MCNFKMSSRPALSQNQIRDHINTGLKLLEVKNLELRNSYEKQIQKLIAENTGLNEKILELSNSYGDAKKEIEELIAENTGLQKKNLELTNSYRHEKRQKQDLILQNNINQQELFAAKSSYSILSREHEELIQRVNKALKTANETVLNLNPTISLARRALVPNISNTSISTTTGNNNQAESPLRSINSQPKSIVSGYQNQYEENEEPVIDLEQDNLDAISASSFIREDLSTILESSSAEQQLDTYSILKIIIERMSSEEIRAHSRSSMNISLSDVSMLVNASSTTGTLEQLDLSEAETVKTVVVNQDINSRVPTSPQYTSTPNVRTSKMSAPSTSSTTTSSVEAPKSSIRHEEDSSDESNRNLPVTELPRKKYKRIRTISFDSEMSVEEEEETDARNGKRPKRAAKPTKSFKEQNLKTKMWRNK